MHYYTIYKPFQVLSQFTADAGKACLADYFSVPKDVYPVGRLDYDSEGLLILTNDKSLNQRLLHPQFKHQRTYWAQVEGTPSAEALLALQQGVWISVDGKKYKTLPAAAALLSPIPEIPERNPPIRFRKSVPDCWIELQLHEGKNRQVRKMTAAVGYPTLRLIRVAIERLTLEKLAPGEIKPWKQNEIYQLLFRK